MKRFLFSSLALVSLLWGASIVARAAEVNVILIQRGDKGLLATMARAGCKPEWISQVMSLSEISFDELRHLQVGRPVTFPQECGEVAPLAVAEQSSQIIFLDWSNSSEQTPEEVAVVDDPDPAEVSQDQSTLKQQPVATQEKASRSEAEIGQPQKDPQPIIIAAVPLGSKVNYAAIGALLTLMVWGAYTYWKKESAVTPREIRVRYFDKTHIFSLFSGPTYKCGLCPERNLQPQHFRRHLDTHPELRMVEVSREQLPATS